MAEETERIEQQTLPPTNPFENFARVAAMFAGEDYEASKARRLKVARYNKRIDAVSRYLRAFIIFAEYIIIALVIFGCVMSAYITWNAVL